LAGLVLVAIIAAGRCHRGRGGVRRRHRAQQPAVAHRPPDPAT